MSEDVWPRGAVSSDSELNELVGEEIFSVCTCQYCRRDNGTFEVYKLLCSRDYRMPKLEKEQFYFRNYWDACVFELKFRRPKKSRRT